ncbi:S-layer homology domain-containing protein, partial [Vallitalea longa]|uniref:S-layer homology domain-containing protein n=1 Tax=Vallitalea longa TaxID=2936439 RepID=UPI0024916A32
DQYGNVMDENISWSLKAPVPGVSINPITGLLEVTNQADAGTVIVVASSDGMQQEKPVKIEKAEIEVTNIIIDGVSSINVPTQKNSPEITDYNAVIKDQYGNVMDENISWSLKTSASGVSINSTTGLLEVTNQADAGTVVVVASSNGMHEEKIVTIEKAEPEVTNIIINGASSINVPTEITSPNETEYKGIVKDQYGNVMDKNISWSLKTPANGVSINTETGLLEATNQADAGTVTVVASSDGMQQEKPVKIEKAEPEVINIIIDGADSINVPTEITSPNETEYKGIVKDQYGNVISQDVSWSLKIPVKGVSINPETGLLKVTNDASYQLIIIMANVENIICTKLVKINKIPILEVDDELNVLLGIDGTMEYSLDNGNIWFSYEKEITFPGCITVKVRYKGIDELTPSESVEVIFTKNTPSAPNVTGNDNTNKLIGADGTMEYSKNNGNTWISYEEGATFSGNVTVQVRYKGTELLTVSEIKEVIFTKNNSSSGGGGHKPPSSGGNNGNNKSPETDETDNNGLEEELIIDEPTTPLGAIEYYDPYIKGFPDGSFKPDKAVTRAEVAAMFARILNLNTEDINDSKYTDVSSEHWANKYIQAITKAGIFKGYTDGTFKPNEPIKRYEIAIVFSGYWDYVGAEVDDGQSIFTDISGHWAQSYINKLYNAGVVNGFGDKTFRPDTDTAREQIVVMINKIIARPTLDTVEPSFTDVTNGHWAFGNIEAASVKFNKKSVDKVNNDNKENDN